MPRTDELVISVRDFLRDDVMAATARSHEFPRARRVELARHRAARTEPGRAAARARTGSDCVRCSASNDDLEALRWRLTNELRDGTMPLDRPGLADHLRQTVVNQVAIDQPSYSGLKTALAS